MEVLGPRLTAALRDPRNEDEWHKILGKPSLERGSIQILDNGLIRWVPEEAESSVSDNQKPAEEELHEVGKEFIAALSAMVPSLDRFVKARAKYDAVLESLKPSSAKSEDEI